MFIRESPNVVYMNTTVNKTPIGIFNDSFPPIIDGVTLTVENYVRWLPLMGMDPCVVTPWNPERVDCGCDVIRYFSLPIYSRHPYRYGYPKADPAIWRKLSTRKFSLVHSHCPFSSGRLAVYVKKSQRVPLIGTFHSKYRTDLEHSLRHLPWMIPIIMRRILRFFDMCDEVWIPQPAVEETVREYGYKGKLTVVDNGIDYADMTVEESDRFKFRCKRELGIEPDTLSLLFVGQHIWEKGIGLIAEALKKIDGDVRFHMNFVGTGYAAKELQAMVDSSGLSSRVRLCGSVTSREELKIYYGASDLFLFPSLYDNAPLVVREAAALGTPSVIPLGSTASEVIRDGVNGFLSERSADAYADMIKRLDRQRDLIASAGLGAKRTLVRSWEDVVEEVADRYRILIKNHQNR